MKTIGHHLAVAALAAVLFIPFLGKAHLFDWDEINFAEAAREMLVTGNWSQVQINFQPFYQKPPLFIWMQAASMKIFGVGEYAARFPNALCGIFSISILFFIGRKLKDVRFAWWWALAYMGSFLPHFYFKSGIIDPWFNLFIFSAVASLAFLSMANKNQRAKTCVSIAGGCSLGLAVLTKGPVAVLLTGLVFVVMLIWLRKKWQTSVAHLVWFSLFALFTTSLWFGYETLTNGTDFIYNFVDYQFRLLTTEDAGHGGPFYYHIIVLLIGCFPASAFLLGYRKPASTENADFSIFNNWMITLLSIVVIVFSLVETKIVHYSSLAYFPLTFMAATVLDRTQKGYRPGKTVWFFLFGFGVLFSQVLVALPFVAMNIESLIPHIEDPFAQANLAANVSWSPGGAIIGLFYLAGIIFSTWFFRNGNFAKSMILLFVVNIMTMQHLMNAIVPKIEGYTQAAAIEYYESLQGQTCSVEVLGFKSYAHLFYARKQPYPTDSTKQNNIEKYFVAKIHKAEQFKEEMNLKEIGRKNGFVFFEE